MAFFQKSDPVVGSKLRSAFPDGDLGFRGQHRNWFQRHGWRRARRQLEYPLLEVRGVLPAGQISSDLAKVIEVRVDE